MSTAAKSKKAAPAPGSAIRTPAQARARANELDAGTDPTDAIRADHLREWAKSHGQAAARERSGMLADAADAHGRAESHRQSLADLGVNVPTREELQAPGAPAKGRAPAARKKSTKGGKGLVSRDGKSVGQIVGAAGDASGVSGIASSGWTIAGSIFVGTIALVLLARLIDTKKGGPQVVQFTASGISRLVDLIVDPVDPFASSSSAALSQTAEAQKQGTTPTATTAGTPAMSTPAPAPSASSTPTK